MAKRLQSLPVGNNDTATADNTKLLEDEVVEIVMNWLIAEKWQIEGFCKGSKHGIDILARKGNKYFIVEAKGARGNPDHKATKKEKFNSGQLLTHLGVAIIKVLKERNNYPNCDVAIAHPNSSYLKQVLLPVIPDLKKAGIRFLWASYDGSVTEDV